MKFRKGQTVYYFEQTGPFQGVIVECGIESATKDLLTGEVTYTVSSKLMFFGWDICNSCRDIKLTADKLYINRKQIEKDYKEFLVYGNLSAKLEKIERLLSSVEELLKPEENKQLFACGYTLDDSNFVNNKIYVDGNRLEVSGIGNIQEEFNKLKKEVNSLKKKIKTPTKKPVKKIEEGKETEVVGL